MPKMRVARRADDLGATHPERVVRFLAHVLLRHRLRERRPSRARLELRLGSKSGVPQHTQRYMPLRWLSQCSPVNARSVPLRVTRNCSGVSCAFHSASDFETLSTMDFLVFKRACFGRYDIVSLSPLSLTTPARRRTRPAWITSLPIRSAATSASSDSSASPTRSRTSSSSRCRRCFRCCAPTSTSRGRCSACWSACSMARAASRSSSQASRSTASARGRCCWAASGCLPAARCSSHSRRARTGCSRSWR